MKQRAGTFIATIFAAGLMCVPLGCGGQPDKPENFTVSGKPIDYWVDLLKQPKSSAKDRAQAVKALGNVGDADPKAIPAVIGALDDKDARVRAEAVLALGKSGPQAGGALPKLKELTQDPDPRVRDYAVKILPQVEAK